MKNNNKQYFANYEGCWEKEFFGEYDEALKYFVDEYSKMFGDDFDADLIDVQIRDEENHMISVE